MAYSRRKFITHTGITAAGILSGLPAHAADNKNLKKLTILHTNDMHSRIEPFPMDGSRNEGAGGVALRSNMIKKVRAEEEHVILLDSGDIFQGTPYFNFYEGEVEMKLMSKLGYDVSTMGNHDFDLGVEGFAKQLKHANFEFVISNYIVKDTPLASRVKSYTIITKNDLRIGIFGLGIELKGLVPEKLYGNTVYLDPIIEGQKMANRLRQDEKCDLVICLSHLGYRYRDNIVSDIHLAQNTHDIDIILGGHTHTFMYQPDIRRNNKGKEVIINQAGWAGLMLGRLDLTMEVGKGKNCVNCKNTFLKYT
jgi:5'-nucleotidase